MTETVTVTAIIRRESPAENSPARYERYQVQGPANMRVLDVLRSVYEEQAGDLAFQFACRIGRCGTCAMKVNGVPVLACQERCKSEMRIEPLTPFPVLRDLVIDRTEVESRYAELDLVPRAAPAGDHPAPIAPERAEALCHLDSCLACMICVSGCPAVEERAFDGPAFMLKLRHMHEHPANERPRLEQALEGGLLECFACDRCTELCPADLNPAQAIRDFRRDLLFGAQVRAA
ncbi:MAG: 2Fe-2S iron-sulfur cluster-binding protein [Pseudomonadota bacterium]|nr:2Fe-2S iron-sulfur cluster-binding protein [Pseudomonadota bacterium]